MLSSENMYARLGGIYSLKRLAEENVDHFHIQVMELLCAFVRQPLPAPPAERRLRDDVQTALDVIINRDDEGIAHENQLKFHIDLNNANLARAFMDEAKLVRAVLYEANLSDVSSYDAEFSGSLLMGCDLSRGQFTNSDFSDTDFRAVKFADANLVKSDLSGAKFRKLASNTSRRNEVSTSGAIFCEVTQEQLDEAMADPDDPPTFDEGTLDPVTGRPISNGTQNFAATVGPRANNY